MSIASEIARLQAAKASLKTSIENKGVNVPASATLDDYSAYVDAISAGGGINATAGTFTLASDTRVYTLTHGLGEVPKLFFIGIASNFQNLTGKTYILVGAFGYSEIALKYRASANSPSVQASAKVAASSITAAPNKCTLGNATAQQIAIGNSSDSMMLIAGVTYYWVAVGSGVFS